MTDARPSKQMTGMYQTQVSQTCLRYKICVDLTKILQYASTAKCTNQLEGWRNVSADVFFLAVELVCDMQEVWLYSYLLLRTCYLRGLLSKLLTI